MSDFNFEDQRRTYDTLGYALDPSVAGATSITAFVGDREKAKQCVSHPFQSSARNASGDDNVANQTASRAHICSILRAWQRQPSFLFV